MGRPLNKKYFGNRNIGTNGGYTADDGIGGTSVASVTLNALGSYTTRATITFSDPDLLGAGGVRATGTITSEALSAVATAAGNGYNVGDLLTVTTAGGSLIAYVATLTGAAGSGVATVNFTGTNASRGSFEALPSGAQATTVAPTGGTGATLTITFRAKAVIVTNQGSGYSHATDASATFTQSVTATSVNMIVDTGIIGTTGNQENSLSIVAYIPAVNGGSSAVLSDIIKQPSGRRYKVKNAQGTGIVKLVAAAPAAGQATLTATDSSGKTYYVTKLTAHKATLTQYGTAGHEFATGASVAWTMNGTNGTKAYSAQPYLASTVNVQIANT